MADLLLHGSPVATLFDLLGHDENDMTFSLGWTLARSERLLKSFEERLTGLRPTVASPVIKLQEHDRAHGGFTDVELLSTAVHIIVEAKKGWQPPSQHQLDLYAARFSAEGRAIQRIVVLTQNGAEEVVRHLLGDWQPPAAVRLEVLGWSDLVGLCQAAGRGARPEERRLLREFVTYVRGVADMRDTDSNRVYVVSLSSGRPSDWPVSWIDIVEKHGRYFFPATGKNWPKTPPNYMGFRYWGRLQSIRHVDGYDIATDMASFFPGVAATDWEPHYVLQLGPSIQPDHEVRTGPSVLRSARVWADIDLLLTCNTITEALQQTRQRREE